MPSRLKYRNSCLWPHSHVKGLRLGDMVNILGSLSLVVWGIAKQYKKKRERELIIIIPELLLLIRLQPLQSKGGTSIRYPWPLEACDACGAKFVGVALLSYDHTRIFLLLASHVLSLTTSWRLSESRSRHACYTQRVFIALECSFAHCRCCPSCYQRRDERLAPYAWIFFSMDTTLFF